MNDGLKILIGAAATAGLAATLHWPLGQGAAFIATLQHGTELSLAQRGLKGIHVSFPGRLYRRVAQLSGSNVGLVERSDALQVLRDVRGLSGAYWMNLPQGSQAAKTAAGQVEAPAPQAAAKFEAPAAAPAPAPAASQAPAPDPAPAPAPVVAAAPVAGGCQGAVDAAVNHRVMSFRSGSAWLNPQSRQLIADVASALKRCHGYRLDIGGHTDNHGSEPVNLTMSQERANRVREALVELGVPAGAVTARGFGSSRPVKAGNAADPANRRISFTVSGGGA